MIVDDARKCTKLLTLHLNKLIILLDAGTRCADKSNSKFVFVRGDNGGYGSVGLEDMVPNDDLWDPDPDAANVAANDIAIQKIFCRLDIPWQLILHRLVGVVSDGASVMGSYVAMLNAARPTSVDPIVCIRDAAHGLMRSVAHGKAALRTWYRALDFAVCVMCTFYRTSSKRMCGLGRHGGKHCFQRQTGVPWVEAMGRELTIVLQNSDASLKHLPKYISAELHTQWKAKPTELLAAPSKNLFPGVSGFLCRWFQHCVCKQQFCGANRGVNICVVPGLVNVMCSQLANLRTQVLQGGWESQLCVDLAISLERGSRACFLAALIADLQSRFAQGSWVCIDCLPDCSEDCELGDL